MAKRNGSHSFDPGVMLAQARQVTDAADAIARISADVAQGADSQLTSLDALSLVLEDER